MLRPVLDPVLGREILSRYTAFASSVGAPAPMEHLMSEGAVQPARYEAYVENLHQVTQAIRKNYVVNLQMDLRFLALQLASAMEQAGRTETRRVQMLERQIAILRDEAGRLKAAALPQPATMKKPSPGRAISGNVPGNGLAAVQNARRAALAPLQPVEPEANTFAPPLAPAERVLAAQHLPAEDQTEGKTAASAGVRPPARKEQGPTESRIPPPVPAQRVLPDLQATAPAGEKRRTRETGAGPERPVPGRTAGQVPAATLRNPAVHLPDKGTVPQQAERVMYAPASGTHTEARGSAPNAPAVRVPLGHMEPDDQDAENAPLPDPRPARLLRPEPSRRVLRRDAPERASTRQENDGSTNFGHTLPRSGPAQPEKTAAAVSAQAKAGDTPAARAAVDAAGVRPTPDLTAASLVHAAAGTREEMPADGSVPRRTVMPGTLPAAQNPDQGRMALRADDGPAAVAVRPAPGLTAAPLVHAAVQEEKEPAHKGTPSTDVTAAATSAPSNRTGRQTTPAATRTTLISAQEPAPAAIRPAPGLTAAPLVHAVVQGEKEPAHRGTTNTDVTAAATSAPQNGNGRQTTSAVTRTAPISAHTPAAVMPAPQSGSNGQNVSVASSGPAAAVNRSAPVQESAPVTARPVPGLTAVPLVHAAAAQTAADPARETSESRKAPAPAVMPAPQNRGQKADSASSSPAAAVKRSAPTAGKDPSPVSVHPAPGMTAAPLVHAVGGERNSVSPQLSSEKKTEPGTAKAASTGTAVPSAASGRAPNTARPESGGKSRQEAVSFRQPNAFVRAPMVPAAGKPPVVTNFAAGTAVSVNRTMPGAAPTRTVHPVPAVPSTAFARGASPVGAPIQESGTVMPGTATRQPSVPAGSPAPMELRRGAAPAAPSAPMASAPGISSWEPGGIRTVHRTRTVRTETKQETPSTVTVRLPGQSLAPAAAGTIGPAEVERIAEKVYRQIEERLRSEKMRRGM